MQAETVLRYWTLFRTHELDVCIDGGWAVDALLGRQTRDHKDLDIALPAHQVPALRRALDNFGFVDTPQPDSWEHNFVLRNKAGDILDVHSYELNADGSNRIGVPYIAEHLRGSGVILGSTVKCIAPEWLLEFHTGYEVDANDWHDVHLLCSHFDLEVPEEFARFCDR